MSTKGGKGYGITHQALYFLLVALHGCEDVLKTQRKVDLHTDLYPSFGSNIYAQMVEQMDSGNPGKDLFLEQG